MTTPASPDPITHDGQFTGEERETGIEALAVEFLSDAPPPPPCFGPPRSFDEELEQADAYFASPDPLDFGRGTDPELALFLLQHANQRLCQPPLSRVEVTAIANRVAKALLRVRR